MELNEHVERLQEPLVHALQELLRYPSVRGEATPRCPFGSEVGKTLESALAIAGNLGFRTANLDGYVGYAEWGEGEEYVAVLGHLDVVPAGEGWSHPPFGGEIHQEKLYGRGTLDDKGPILAALFGLKAVAQSGLPLSRRVRVIFGTCEETTWEDIPYYLERELLPVLGFTPDGNFPLIHAEKGHLAFDFVGEQGSEAGRPVLRSLQGGQVANMVPPSAQAILQGISTEEIVDALALYNRAHGSQIDAIPEGQDTLLRSAGVAAHAALPHLGRNAIMQLVGFLDTLGLQPSGAAAFLSFLQETIGMETDGKSLGLACSDPVSGALTLNVGVIHSTEQELRVRVDIRYPISARSDDLLGILRHQVEGRGLKLECSRITEPLHVALDDPLVTALQRVYEAQTGLEGKPLAIGGRTYASAMPHVVAFGPLFPGDPDLDHQVDECISLDNLRRLTSIYAQAILELAR